MLPDEVLTATIFGHDKAVLPDPRCRHIELDQLAGAGLAEVWRGSGPVRHGAAGPLCYVEDGDHLAGWLDLEESGCGGLKAAAEAAYLAVLRFHATSPYRHVWRIWNYISAINEGIGDDERYRQFCVGRARALATVPLHGSGIGYPAATAVGNPLGARTLRLAWIAAREPGQAIESPRQLSAYRYPRRYGPVSPNFSRAMLVPDGLLLVSGTASIVGHETRHDGDPIAQLHETLDNLEALVTEASAVGSFHRTPLGTDSLLKIYLRHHDDRPAIEQDLRERLGNSVPVLILGADICRSDLLVEIEAVHQFRGRR
ncbi:MAG: pteridine-dependent deoxygenase [Gammaproteobacteria bacterium PRO9]|nr:pteridine-dependent deoxygenase [Gammaproteobacteria bacterium PRO9]